MTRVPYARAPQKLVRRNPPGRFLTKPKPHRFCFPERGTFTTTAQYVATFCQLNNLIPQESTMHHTLQATPAFNPITLTITMESPEDALLIWATLGVATSDVRKLVTALNKESSRRSLEAALDAPIEESSYPVWDALDEELRKAGLI